MKTNIKFTPTYTPNDILSREDKRNVFFIPENLNLELYHNSNTYRQNIDHFISKLDQNQIQNLNYIIRDYLFSIINKTNTDIIYIKSILINQQKQIDTLNVVNFGIEKPKTISKKQFRDAIKTPNKR